MLFQGSCVCRKVSPTLAGNEPALELRSSFCGPHSDAETPVLLPAPRLHPVVSLRTGTLLPELRVERAVPRPPAFFSIVTLLGLLLMLNNLNTKFPNP